ncbi:hypothetical protein NLM33_01775 [Bradyrhizobium sp. CCGUVB1N3]|uniref:hypothetical protein n=1 Tax=Bradyrhizobium sp. CCGUVB1N3 TaxID=2949629 RepID=UPI0020B27B40|nr:hypothetical protein [Bradyrhizobium sp. CCGUVB1N3]MCP3469049.1 hypothetical protein [Bradyrhizobium sp. CCGUVB1N3]
MTTAMMPMLPLAPALFSTMTGWLHASESFRAINRAIMSLVPPAWYGETMVICRLGKEFSAADVDWLATSTKASKASSRGGITPASRCACGWRQMFRSIAVMA